MSGAALDLVVVGAGPSGLCAAFHARRRQLSVTVLERSDTIGGAWSRVSADMRCLSPRERDRLPDGSWPQGSGLLASAAEVRAALDDFAARWQLPVELGVEVRSVGATSSGLRVETSAGATAARRVLVATGEYGRPFTPALPGSFAGAASHSSEFDGSGARPGERLVVIGGGNSGALVAARAALRGAEVVVSSRSAIRRPPPIRQGFFGALLFHASGLPVDRLPFRGGCRPTVPVADPWLYEAIRGGRVALVGETVALHRDAVGIAGGARVPCDRVVFATGFRRDTTFLGGLVTLDSVGSPRHRRGVSPEVPGLGFVGIPCMRTRRSGFLRGFGDDADAVVEALL